LIDKESGVLSKTFTRVFFEDIADESPKFRTLAEKVYRECSEYVHGNAYTYQAIKDKLRFSEEIFTDWHEKVSSIRFVVLFALCARYLTSLDSTSRIDLEHIIIDELGHIPAIRALFEETE